MREFLSSMEGSGTVSCLAPCQHSRWQKWVCVHWFSRSSARELCLKQCLVPKAKGKMSFVFSHRESLPSVQVPVSSVGHDDTLLHNPLFTLFLFFSGALQTYWVKLSYSRKVVILNILVNSLPLTYGSTLEFSGFLCGIDVWETTVISKQFAAKSMWLFKFHAMLHHCTVVGSFQNGTYDPCFVVVTPRMVPSPQVRAGPSDLLLTNRMWHKWWDIILHSVIILCHQVWQLTAMRTRRLNFKSSS